jgi:hypothetical protein
MGLHKLAGGAVPVADKEHPAIWFQAVSYQRPEGLKAFGWDVREPKAEEDYVVTAVRLPGENGTQRHTASPRSQARGPGAAVSQSMNAAGTPDRKTVFHGKSSL